MQAPPLVESPLSRIVDSNQQLGYEESNMNDRTADGNNEEQQRAKLLKDIQDEEIKNLTDFTVARPYLHELIGKWQLEEQRTESNRLARDIDVDIDQMREVGDIDDDEAFIPVRVIDSNIQREIPPFMNYLKNSRRVAIFTDKIDATFDTQTLEDAFTKVITYKGWEKPFFKCLDGAMTHGWASVEVMYDESKPGHVSIEYIAHEDLLFAQDSKDIQASSVVLRKYKVTPFQLKQWVAKFGFDIIQVDAIIQKYKEQTNKDKTIIVYKRFCKHQNSVYVSWFSDEGKVADWLKKPIKLDCGISELVDKMVQQQVPQQMPDGSTVMGTQNVPSKDWQTSEVVNYPIFILPYKETEKPMIFDHFGRVFYDQYKQEAQTATTTSFVNGINRAQRIFASPKEDTMNDGKPAKQLATIKWANGSIFDKPMVFWNMPYPDPMILKALQYFDVANAQEIGQTDFAATNREDSRKTATEIKAATNQEQLLNSVDLTIFSTFCREVYAFAWLIVRSQALQDKIKFLQISKQDALKKQTANNGQPPPPNVLPMPQQGMASQMPPTPNLASAAMPNGQPQQQVPAALSSIVNAMGNYQNELEDYINDVDTLVRDYDVRAAGDVDVIQKAELVQQMQQGWPVIQTTPLASRFLSDLIKLQYPQDGGIYSDILQQGNPKNQVIQALSSLVQELITYPDAQKQLKANPQLVQQLEQIKQQTMQALKAP